MEINSLLEIIVSSPRISFEEKEAFINELSGDEMTYELFQQKVNEFLDAEEAFSDSELEVIQKLEDENYEEMEEEKQKINKEREQALLEFYKEKFKITKKMLNDAKNAKKDFEEIEKEISSESDKSQIEEAKKKLLGDSN